NLRDRVFDHRDGEVGLAFRRQEDADDILDRIPRDPDDHDSGECLRDSQRVDGRVERADEPVRDEGGADPGGRQEGDPGLERRAAARIVSPRTRRAFANREPRIDVFATTISPADTAKRTTNSSGRLPSVDCRTPVAAGPKRAATVSVAMATIQARPPRASPDTT